MISTRTMTGLFLALAWCACSAPKPATGPEQHAMAKEICQHDEDCSPFHACTSDHHCRCELDADCASSQACRGGLCLPR